MESILAVESALLRGAPDSAEGLRDIDVLDAVVVFVVLYVERKGGHGDGLANPPGDSLLSWSCQRGETGAVRWWVWYETQHFVGIVREGLVLCSGQRNPEFGGGERTYHNEAT